MLQVDLLWTHPDPGAAKPEGHSFEGFFRDGGAWRVGAYEVPQDAIIAARSEYRRPDRDGYGVAVRVRAGTHHIVMAFDPGRAVLGG